MYKKYGETCPAYDWVNCEKSRCDYCKGCSNQYADGVECRYSMLPTHEPRFKVGENVWFLEYHDLLGQSTIRKMAWDRWQWIYWMKRKQNPNSDDTVFSTRREGEEYILRTKAEALYKELVRFKDVYGELPAMEKLKIEQK